MQYLVSQLQTNPIITINKMVENYYQLTTIVYHHNNVPLLVLCRGPEMTTPRINKRRYASEKRLYLSTEALREKKRFFKKISVFSFFPPYNTHCIHNRKEDHIIVPTCTEAVKRKTFFAYFLMLFGHTHTINEVYNSLNRLNHYPPYLL